MFYDFNKPEDLAPELKEAFDMVVIDPPFITREVWEKVTIKLELMPYSMQLLQNTY